MPLANFNRINLDQLFLPFLQRLLDAVAACNERGAHFFATCGYRTFREQLEDWQQGRTIPGRIITDAGPGESPHNFGLAVDFARIEAGQYVKDAAGYAVLGEEAKKRGLVWGGTFHHLKDAAHVQWPGYLTSRDMAPLKTTYLSHPEGPLSAVFAYLSTRPEPPGVGGPAGGARQEG